MFSKHIEVRDLNEAEVLAILEVLRLYSKYFLDKLIVEINSLNAISWVNSLASIPWRFQFQFSKKQIFLILYPGGVLS